VKARSDPRPGTPPDPARRCERRPRVAALDVVDEESRLTPSSISSRMEPRLNAMTGVPHAMASITESPKGLVEANEVGGGHAPPP